MRIASSVSHSPLLPRQEVKKKQNLLVGNSPAFAGWPVCFCPRKELSHILGPRSEGLFSLVFPPPSAPPPLLSPPPPPTQKSCPGRSVYIMSRRGACVLQSQCTADYVLISCCAFFFCPTSKERKRSGTGPGEGGAGWTVNKISTALMSLTTLAWNYWSWCVAVSADATSQTGWHNKGARRVEEMNFPIRLRDYFLISALCLGHDSGKWNRLFPHSEFIQNYDIKVRRQPTISEDVKQNVASFIKLARLCLHYRHRATNSQI